MTNRSLLLIFALSLLANVVFAQEEEEESTSFNISGSVDAYFRAPFDSKSRIDAHEAPGTSFANLPGFSLGMANLVVSKEGEKAGFVADLVFGPRGAEAVFNSPAPLNIVNQLYAYWNASESVTFTLGNFNTFLGYEVISPASNFNYSTSYMFSYGPFSHSGLKADFAFSDNVSGMLAVLNPTDWTDFNPFGSYTYGAQIGFSGIYLNFLYGDQDGKLDEELDIGSGMVSAGGTFQADITAGFDITDSFYFGVNATYNTTSTGEEDNGSAIVDVSGDAAGFYGAAAYLQYATSDNFSIGTRVEYFKEYNFGLDVVGLDSEGDGSVIDFTLTGKYNVGDLTIIPELRLDSTSEDTFTKKDQSGSDKNLSSFVLAAVYSF